MIRIATRKNFHSDAELRSWSKLPLELRDLYPSRSRTLAGNAEVGGFANDANRITPHPDENRTKVAGAEYIGRRGWFLLGAITGRFSG